NKHALPQGVGTVTQQKQRESANVPHEMAGTDLRVRRGPADVGKLAVAVAAGPFICRQKIGVQEHEPRRLGAREKKRSLAEAIGLVADPWKTGADIRQVKLSELLLNSAELLSRQEWAGMGLPQIYARESCVRCTVAQDREVLAQFWLKRWQCL